MVRGERRVLVYGMNGLKIFHTTLVLLLTIVKVLKLNIGSSINYELFYSPWEMVGVCVSGIYNNNHILPVVFLFCQASFLTD